MAWVLSLLFVLPLLIHPILSISLKYGASDPGAPYVKDGPTATTQFPQWELGFHSENYVPICGTFWEIETIGPWSNTAECEPAMTYYSIASNTSAALYETYTTSGAKQSSQQIGAGSSLCMCFTLMHTSGIPADICLLVGSDADVRIRAGVAVGVHQATLSRLRSRVLPSCDQIGKFANIPAGPIVTGTVYVNVPSTPTTTPTTTSTPSNANSLSALAMWGKFMVIIMMLWNLYGNSNRELTIV